MPFPSTKGYLCYIDESGDEGFRFGQGSSDWFIISAIVCRQCNDHFLQNLVDEVKTEIKMPMAKQLHWKKLHHLEKKLYTEKLTQLKMKAITVAVHKPTLIERENFQERYRLYYYSVRYLLERLTWAVRDAEKKQKEGDGKVGICFSNRSGMGYDELRSYLDRLKKQTEEGQDVRIEWQHLHIGDVRAVPPGKKAGLQIADAVAGLFYNALETCKTKGQITEYLKLFLPQVYSYRGEIMGYGLKFIPRETVRWMEGQPEMSWCKGLILK